MRARAQIARHFLFWTVILTIILLPFFFFGEKIENWTESVMNGSMARPMAALLMGGLLSSDILLPVPSSLASTACGYLLGILPGTLVSFLGMTVSSIAGYWLGKKPGTFALYRSLGHKEAERLEHLNRRFGAWLIVIARPVPVLAEASVFFAGLTHMRFRKFMVLVSLSNLGISALYAAVGAKAAELQTFIIAFGASMALPMVFMAASAIIARLPKTAGEQD